MTQSIAFVWSNFGPYHVDRLEAVAEALAHTHQIIGIEIARSTEIYAWDRPRQPKNFKCITLFADRTYESVSATRRLMAYIDAFRRIRPQPRHVFLCHYERPEIFLLALWLRLAGCRCYVMFESKFDDKPRFLWREVAKMMALVPYRGCIVGGPRIAEYVRLLGFSPSRIEYGYDTVSMTRVRALAGSPPAPAGYRFIDRHFTIIARFVKKKNLAMALEAYAHYCKQAGKATRELHLCGSGELEPALRDQARSLGLEGVRFRGFLQEADIAKTLAFSLALILPSTEEPWGLVVNEALAMGLPILCSLNPGSRDLLVRTGVNGYIFEPDNPKGLGSLMVRLASDEAEWAHFCHASQEFSKLADTKNFADGVLRLVQGRESVAANLGTLEEPIQPGCRAGQDV